MTVASGRRPDASTLVPQQQGGSLELRAHGRRHPAAPGSRLDLTDGPGEHRDDIAAVADASLLRRGATASAPLALARSNPTLLPLNARTQGPPRHAPPTPTPGPGPPRYRAARRPAGGGRCLRRGVGSQDDRHSARRDQTVVTRPGVAAGQEAGGS